MSNKILLKRSSVAGSIPTTASLDVGEVALNTFDGKLFLRRSGSLGNDILPLVTIGIQNTGSIQGNFTGSLFGTASFATTASYAQNSPVSTTSIQNAYNRLRYQSIGYFDVTGSATVTLPTSSLGGNAFLTSSIDYINVSIMVKQANRWTNDLLSVQIYTSSTNVYVELSAPALTSTDQYKLLAVNENPTDYVVI